MFDDKSNEEKVDMFKDQLEQIKNDKGEQKYGSLEDALKALKHSQDFIPTLQQENQQAKDEIQRLKAELDKRSSVEDVVGRLVNPPTTIQEEAPKEQPSNSSLNEESVQALIANALQQREIASQGKLNQDKVVNAFTDRYGSSAVTKFKELASEVGMSSEDLQALSAKSPEIVLKLMPERVKDNSVTSSSINSSAFSGSTKQSPSVLPAPETTVLAGADAKDLRAEMLRHKAHVYEKLGVTL